MSNASDINRDKVPPNVLADGDLCRILISYLVAPDQTWVLAKRPVLLAPPGLAIRRQYLPTFGGLSVPPLCSNHGHNYKRYHRRHRCYPSRDQDIYPRCRLDQLVSSVSNFAVDHVDHL